MGASIRLALGISIRLLMGNSNLQWRFQFGLAGSIVPTAQMCHQVHVQRWYAVLIEVSNTDPCA
jgi:hypothetical protein